MAYKTFFASLLGACVLVCHAERLPIPDEAHSFPTLSGAVSEMDILGDKGLLQVPWRGNFLIQNNDWTVNKAYSIDAFANSKRVPIQGVGEANWRGMVRNSANILLLGSQSLEIMALNFSYQVISKQSVAYDLIRPPGDPQGEAPSWEVQRFRKSFVAAFDKADPETFVGLEHQPAKWGQRNDFSSYLVSTRIKGFPLVTLRCRKDVASECILDRGCFMNDASAIEPSAVSGLAYSKKRNLILVGDRSRNAMVAYQGSSCFDIRRVNEILLPERLKTMMGLFIDDADRLWISTEAADDYYNSSVFMWTEW